MTDLKIEISPDVLKQTVEHAILKSLDERAREALLQRALSYLLTEQRVGYGSPQPSPLAQAFNYALEAAARQVCKEVVETDPTIKARVKEMLGKVVEKAFDAANEEKIADAMVKALSTAMWELQR